MSTVAQMIDQRSHLLGIGLPLYLQVHPHQRPRARPGREPSRGGGAPPAPPHQETRKAHPHQRPRARPGREPSGGEVDPSSLLQQDHRNAVLDAVNDTAHRRTAHLYLTAAAAGVRIVSTLSRRPPVRKITPPP